MATPDVRGEILYRRCVAANISACAPNDWILRRAEMRRFWEQYVRNIAKPPAHIRSMLTGNVFTEYMAFMYTAA